MKKHINLFYIAVYFYVLLFLSLPPLFNGYKQNNVANAQISPTTLATYCFLTLCLYFFLRHAQIIQKKSVTIFKCAIFTIIGFFFTVVTTFLIISISKYFSQPYSQEIVHTNFLLFLCSVTVMACFEEILYRQFLPEMTKFLFISESAQIAHNFISLLAEFTIVILFALAHRYLGYMSILNAFFCGIILRNTAKKTGTIISTCLIHTLYNICFFLYYFKTAG